MDEIEKKLLSGCGKEIGDSYVDCGEECESETSESGCGFFLCDLCLTKLNQHRETKKWIEGLIDESKKLFRNRDCIRMLKKRISGEIDEVKE